MNAASLLAPLVLVGVLIVSAAAKLRSPRASRDAFISLRLPRWLAGSSAPAALPWAELGLALALVLVPGWPAVVAAGVGAVLMVAYLVLVLRALGFDEPVRCHCFGDLGLGEVNAWTAVRNAVLVVVGALTLWAALDDGRSLVSRWWNAPGQAWGWLAMTGLLVMLVVLIVGPGPTRASEHSGGLESSAMTPDEELEDYLRQPIPYATLLTHEGHPVHLHDLARHQAVVLVLLNVHCGSCQRVLARLDHWARELHPVVLRPVYATLGPELTQLPEASGTLSHALQDPEGHLAQLLRVGSPAAVLLGADGLLAGGPVSGETAVVEMVEQIIEQLREARADQAVESESAVVESGGQAV